MAAGMDLLQKQNRNILGKAQLESSNESIYKKKNGGHIAKLTEVKATHQAW